MSALSNKSFSHYRCIEVTLPFSAVAQRLLIGGLVLEKNLRHALKNLYPAPPPLDRDRFLQSFPEPELSFTQFLWRQAGYIRKGNWLMAAGILSLAALSGLHANGTTLQILGACTPFLALMTVAEGSRSVRFGMEELELSSRFPLKVIVAARLGILGLGNLLLLGGIGPLMLSREGGSLFYSAVSLLLPYLLTAFLNLWAVRSCQGNGGLYLSMAITVLVSGLCLLLGKQSAFCGEFIPDSLQNFILAICTLFFTVLTGREYLKTIRQSEEYRWSLQ